MSEFQILRWMADTLDITQPYGVRIEQYKKFGLPWHVGIDIRGNDDGSSKVYAVNSGTVKFAGYKPNGYGYYVIIDHPNGYSTVYAHLLKELNVKSGHTVNAGHDLGRMGSTGNSTAVHLHFEIRKGDFATDAIDPTPYLVPHMNFRRPSGPFVSGWIAKRGITAHGELAKVNKTAYSLRAEAGQDSDRLGSVREFSMMIVTGKEQKRKWKDETYFFIPVSVPETALSGYQSSSPLTGELVDGWGYRSSIAIEGNGPYASVKSSRGINVRSTAEYLRNKNKIGLLKGGSRLKINGEAKNGYHPITAQRRDFTGAINESLLKPTPPAKPKPPAPKPPEEPKPPAPKENKISGWAYVGAIDSQSGKVTNQSGANVRTDPKYVQGNEIGRLKHGSHVEISGPAQSKGIYEYYPITANRSDFSGSINEALLKSVAPPELKPPVPNNDNKIKGWAYVGAINSQSGKVTHHNGANVRAEPKYVYGNVIGLLKLGSSVEIAGPAKSKGLYDYYPILANRADFDGTINEDLAKKVSFS